MYTYKDLSYLHTSFILIFTHASEVQPKTLFETFTSLDYWSNSYLVRINERKTAHAIFYLSTKTQYSHLTLNGHEMLQGETPTYSGVIFDLRVTWKAQIKINRTEQISE